MHTHSSMNYSVKDKTSHHQKSRIENRTIDRNKLIRDGPLKCNKKRPSLTKICSFIQKLSYRFKDTLVSKNALDMEPSINDLIGLYGNMHEHKISEIISLTEVIDVGKTIDFDILQEDLVDIDMLFDDLVSKIDRTTNLSQEWKPNLNWDNLFDPFDLEHSNNTLTTITSIDSYMSHLSGNNTTISFDNDFELDLKLISDFSVLSKLITIISPPPPRSKERPIIPNIDNAKDFYYGKMEFRNFIDKLKLDFANVIILDDSSKSCSNNGSLDNVSKCLNKKKVSFSTDITLGKTYTDNEYDRSDSNVAYTLQALTNPEYVQSIKSEINEFKQKEMIVHKDSILFTHFI